MPYAVRKSHSPNEWLIFHPGSRLDHWGPIQERAEYLSRENAETAIRHERAERFAEIVKCGDPNDPMTRNESR